MNWKNSTEKIIQYEKNLLSIIWSCGVSLQEMVQNVCACVQISFFCRDMRAHAKKTKTMKIMRQRIDETNNTTRQI